MARYTVSAVTTAGSTTLPIISLYGGTTVRPRLRELGVFNTTATAVSLKLVRVTTTGTQGTALTEMPLVPEDPAALATAFNTHSAGPTITTGDLYRWSLGAAIGSGVVLTFPDTGIVIPATANNGLAVVVSTGTGQACDAWLTWDE
jgi:hypothetical protein